jgi:hypothetical protein
MVVFFPRKTPIKQAKKNIIPNVAIMPLKPNFTPITIRKISINKPRQPELVLDLLVFFLSFKSAIPYLHHKI